jgi:hypothetical protein
VEDLAETHRQAAAKAAIARQLEMSRNSVAPQLGLSEPPRNGSPLVGLQLDA